MTHTNVVRAALLVLITSVLLTACGGTPELAESAGSETPAPSSAPVVVEEAALPGPEVPAGPPAPNTTLSQPEYRAQAEAALAFLNAEQTQIQYEYLPRDLVLLLMDRSPEKGRLHQQNFHGLTQGQWRDAVVSTAYAGNPKSEISPATLTNALQFTFGVQPGQGAQDGSTFVYQATRSASGNWVLNDDTTALAHGAQVHQP